MCVHPGVQGVDTGGLRIDPRSLGIDASAEVPAHLLGTCGQPEVGGSEEPQGCPEQTDR